MSTMVIDLDPRLHILYEWARRVLPEYNKNMSQWLFECVLNFMIDHRQVFRLSALFSPEEMKTIAHSLTPEQLAAVVRELPETDRNTFMAQLIK